MKPKTNNKNEDLFKITAVSNDQSKAVLPKAEFNRITQQSGAMATCRPKIPKVQEGPEQRALREKYKKDFHPSYNQRMLAEKRMREEKEEKEGQLHDELEAATQQQTRAELVAKVKDVTIHRMGYARAIDSAVVTSLVKKENDALLEIKKEKQLRDEEVEKEYVKEMKASLEEPLRLEHEIARKKQAERKQLQEFQKQQIEEKARLVEPQRRQLLQEGKEIMRRDAEVLRELRDKRIEKKQQTIEMVSKHLAEKKAFEIKEARKQEEEEQKREQIQSEVEDKFSNVHEKRRVSDQIESRQRKIEMVTAALQKVVDKKALKLQKQEQRTEAVEEQLKEAHKQRLKAEQEKREEMFRSIAAHRESVQLAKQDMGAEEERQRTLQEMKKAEALSVEAERQNEQKKKEEVLWYSDFNAKMVAEKLARHQELRQEKMQRKKMQRKLNEEMENDLQQYAEAEIKAARDDQRDTAPFYLAAKIHGGERDPSICRGVWYGPAENNTHAELPEYAKAQYRKHYRDRDTWGVNPETRLAHPLQQQVKK